MQLRSYVRFFPPQISLVQKRSRVSSALLPIGSHMTTISIIIIFLGTMTIIETGLVESVGQFSSLFFLCVGGLRS